MEAPHGGQLPWRATQTHSRLCVDEKKNLYCVLKLKFLVLFVTQHSLAYPDYCTSCHCGRGFQFIAEPFGPLGMPQECWEGGREEDKGKLVGRLLSNQSFIFISSIYWGSQEDYL